MYKKLMLLWFLIFLCSYSFSEIIGGIPIGIPVVSSDFDIEMIVSDNLIEKEIIIDGKKYTTYISKDNSYEIRILKYKLVDNELDFEELEGVFIMSIFPIIFNLIEIEYSLGRTIIYNPDDVKNENNGDYGFAAFIKYDGKMETGFYAGYEYVIMNIFIKYNHGIILKTIMMNDLEILETENFKNDFLIFKYKDQ
ncbi:MAG: hypothetical protein FWG07_11195 [Treponema sp.]|nr:hypothetical protein [Treponema sp.]